MLSSYRVPFRLDLESTRASSPRLPSLSLFVQGIPVWFDTSDTWTPYQPSISCDRTRENYSPNTNKNLTHALFFLVVARAPPRELIFRIESANLRAAMFIIWALHSIEPLQQTATPYSPVPV